MAPRRNAFLDKQNHAIPSRTPSLKRNWRRLDALRTELVRQRSTLLHELLLDAVPSEDARAYADIADQASADQAMDLTRIGRMRARTRLREIDRALEVMTRRGYGRCIDCRQDIPLSRLRVQPAALLCVSCQASTETASSRPELMMRELDYALPDD